MTNKRFSRGWYCAALRRELVPDQIVERPFCERVLQLRATREGLVSAQMDGHQAPVRVHDDVVFVWEGSPGDVPSYELPDLDREGFSPSTFDVFDVPASPSLIMRDLADYEHFDHVHRYGRITIEEPFKADGACCSMAFSFDWPLVLGLNLITTRARSRSVCFGLGYQLTTVVSLGGIFETHHRVMPTPTRHGQTRVTLGMEIRVRGPLGRLPMLGQIGHAFGRRAFQRDTATDAVGWRALSEHEAEHAQGTLASYWDWAGKFLPEQPPGTGDTSLEKAAP